MCYLTIPANKKASGALEPLLGELYSDTTKS